MRKEHETCTVEGCGRKHKSQGYCQSHYTRHQRGMDVNAPMAQRQMTKPGSCKELGCPSPVKAKGYCGTHYQRFLRYGTTERLRWGPDSQVEANQ